MRKLEYVSTSTRRLSAVGAVAAIAVVTLVTSGSESTVPVAQASAGPRGEAQFSVLRQAVPGDAALASFGGVEGGTPNLRSSTPAAPEAQMTRGVAVAQGGVAVTIATSDDASVLCTESRPVAAIPGQGIRGCVDAAAVSAERLPFTIGYTAGRAWVSALAPDGIRSVTASNADGGTATVVPVDNVAVVTIPTTAPIAEVAWVMADGTTKRLRTGAQDAR